MKKIIAIHGLMGAGKDTVGSYIAFIHRLQSKKSIYNQRFAQCVKENVSNLTGIQMSPVTPHSYHNEIHDFTREQKAMWLDDWGCSLGALLQVYATEAVRDNVHSDAWILALKPKLKEGINVITDLRFENEVEWLKEQKALLIKVKRDRGVENETRSTEHISESGLPDPHFHHIIENDGTLKQLFEKVDAILRDEGLIKCA